MIGFIFGAVCGALGRHYWTDILARVEVARQQIKGKFSK